MRSSRPAPPWRGRRRPASAARSRLQTSRLHSTSLTREFQLWPPACGRGAGTPCGGSLVDAPTEAAYLIGKLGDGDRLLDRAGEADAANPVRVEIRAGAHGDDRKKRRPL